MEMVKNRPAKRPLLLVEDDFDIRSALEHLLSSYGYEVHSAANGEEALSHLHSAEAAFPGVIFTDYRMPVMDGADLCEIVSRDPKLGAIPLVVMSADSDARENPKLSNAVAILKKPYNIDVILEFASLYC